MIDQGLIDRILKDPSTEVTSISTPTPFGYDTILHEIYSNEEIGYRYIKEYTWDKAYNTNNEFGGMINTKIEERIEELIR